MKTKIKYTIFCCLTLILSVTAFIAIKEKIFAVTESLTITSVVSSSQTVSENTLLGVFKIQFNGVESNETLQSIDVVLNSSASSDVGAITSNVLEDNRIFNGGWQLWKDSSSGTAGTFERYTDTQLILDADTLNYGSNGSFTMDLDVDEPVSEDDIFYVVIYTDNSALPSNTSFTVSMTDIVTSGASQPSVSTTTSSYITLSSTGKCIKMELLDGTLTAGDRIRMVFNQSMDFSYISTYGLSWYIYQYDSNWYSLSFGTNPSYAYSNTTGANNDTITITLGSSPTIVTNRPIYYSLPTSSSSYSWAYGQKSFDLVDPTLNRVELITDAQNDGAANDIGDQIAFQFSESIDILSEDDDGTTNPLNASTLSALVVLSGGASYGSTPDVTFWGPNTLVLTLNENLGIDLIAKTVTPSIQFKDLAGNALSNTNPVTIVASTIKPLDSLAFTDQDTVASYISKQDMTVDYTMPIANNIDHVDFYLVPENIGFSASSLYRINSADLECSSGENCTFEGEETDYSLYYDSRTNLAAIYDNDWSNAGEYNYIQENTKYIVYGVLSTVSHGTETVTNVSIAKPSEPLKFTSEPWSYTTGTTPWIKQYSPNTTSVPRNRQTFSIQYSEALDESTVEDIDNYILKYDSDGNWSYDTVTALSEVSYDSETYTIHITTENTLASSKWYYLRVKSQVESALGVSVGDYSGFYFQTGSSTDTSAPTVSSSSISDESINVDPSRSSLNFVFSESMNPLSLIEENGATLEPAVIDANLTYDIASNALKYVFGTQNMAENTVYSFLIDSSKAKDSQGNYLSSDYEINFTTGELDLAQPRITWSTFDGYNLYVGFDKDMKEGDVEDDINWTLTCDGSTQTLTWATFTYDDSDKELKISGLYCSDGADYVITAASNVRGSNNQNIDVNYTSSTSEVESATTNSGSVSGSSTYDTYNNYNKASVYPSDSSAAAQTSYSFYMPINKALGNEYKIEIEWPSGFDISNVTLKTPCSGGTYSSSCSYNNADINGSWNGLYDQDGGDFYSEGVIKAYDLVAGVTCPSDENCITNDTIQNKTTLTLWMDYDDDDVVDANAVSKASDYIYFDLANVVNPSDPSTIDWYSNTGGYTVNVYTKTDIGANLEGPLASYAFSIIEAGTGTLSGRVTANTEDGDGIEGATVYAYGPASKSTVTDSDGNWEITGAQDGTWWFYAYPPANSRYTYNYSSYSSCAISDSVQACTYNSTLPSLDYSISGTIVHGADLAGTDVNVWQYNKDTWNWSSTTVTLQSDGTTPFTIYTAEGKVEVGLYESYYKNKFVAPSSQTVNVTGDMTSVNFNLTTADIDLPFTVLDDDGNGLLGVSIGAWSYDEGYGFSVWGTTDKNGQATLKVVAGDYTAYAYQWGFGNAQKAVSVNEDGSLSPSTGARFTFRQADSTISGRVLDDSDEPIQWASISYRDSDGISQWSSTDSNGDYTLWVPGGTGVSGTVAAYSWQHGGNLPAASGVDLTDFAVSSSSTITGKDFKYDPSAYGNISGQISTDDGGIQWSSVWTEEVNSETGLNTGNYNNSWASTDSDGNFSIKVTKNTDSTCYNLHAWAGSFGELPEKECLDVSSGDLANQDWDLGALQTLTVNVTGATSDVNLAYLTLKQTDTDIDSSKWETITLADGAATESMEIWDGTYKAKLYIDGFGEISPDSPYDQSFTVSGEDLTISFDLSDLTDSIISLSGQVTDENGDPVANARVNMFEASTNQVNGTKTDSSGNYSLVAMDGSYTIFAAKNKYINSDKMTVTESGTYDFTVTSAASTITGTAYRDGSVVEGAWIMAASGEKWSSAKSEGDGTFTLYVSDDSSLTWTLSAMTKNGYSGTEENISSGDSGVTLNLDTLSNSTLADEACTSSVPSQSVTLDDSDGTNTSIKLPANAYNDSSGNNSQAGTLCVSDIAIPSVANDGLDIVESKEILLNDSEGVAQTKFQSDLDLTFTYEKSEIEDLLENGSLNTCEDLSAFSINYWDDSSQTWISMPTTRIIKIQTLSGGDFEDIDYDSATANICDNADYYNDYKITLQVQSDHLTVFGLGIPEAEDNAEEDSDNNNNNNNSSASSSSNASGNLDSYLDDQIGDNSSDADIKELVVDDDNEKAIVSDELVEYQVDENVDYAEHWAFDYITELYARNIVSGCDDEANYCPDKEITRAELLKIVMNLYGVNLQSDLNNPFIDLDENHWAYKYILNAYDAKIIKGYEDKTFKADNNINRAEAMKIILNTANVNIEEGSQYINPFVDIDISKWYAKYVLKAYTDGIVQGYEENEARYFKPENNITRAETAKVVVLLDLLINLSE